MTRVSLLSVFAALAAVVLPSRGASALRGLAEAEIAVQLPAIEGGKGQG